jgi:hypothetical protein
MSYIYIVKNDYRAGIPQTPTGTIGPFRMVALHDTEGGVGDAGAIGTIYFLIERSDRNASYHELWSWNETTRSFVVRRIVPPTSAAHSVNPFPPSKGGSYEPDATVREALGARVNDPNRVIYAVSIAGTKADVNRWSSDPDFVAACKRRLAEIRSELNIPNRKGEHFRFNPSTRSDWGPLLTPALDGQEVMDWYKNIVAITPVKVRLSAETSYRLRPDLSAESQPFVLGVEDTRIMIGTVKGFDFGAGPDWGVMLSNNGLLGQGGLRVFHTQDILEQEALGTTQTVEVVKEVPDPDAYDNGVSAEKSRLRMLLGLE